MRWEIGVGTLVLAGGGDLGSTPELDRDWLCRAGPDPSVVFLPTASGSRKAGPKFVGYYRSLGAEAVAAVDLFERSDAENPAICAALESADLIYIGGGIASRLIQVLDGTPALATMTQALRRGAVVVAMSAGARAAGDTAVVRGNGLGALRLGMQPGALREEPDGPVQWMDGFCWITGALVEPHLYEWNRLGHLFLAKAVHPDKVIIGLDENTALVCRNGEAALVQGEGNVYMLPYPPTGCALPAHERSLQLSGLTMDILAAGATWAPGV